MSNLLNYPLEDNFKTTLTQELTTTGTTAFVASTPNFTFPASVTTYLVLNPGKSNQETAEISAFDSSAKTFTIDTRNITKGASVTSTAQTHTVGSEVIISDNFAFWDAIKTAINSKLDNTGGNTTTTFDLQVSGSSFRIRKDGSDMKFTDDSNSEISLTTIAAAAGADQKVGITLSDTTPAPLDSKLTAGDGLTKTVINPGGNETLDLDIDLTDTTKFSTAGVADRAAVTDGSGNLFQATETARGGVERATDAEATTGTDTTRYISPKQAKDNYAPLKTTVVYGVETSLLDGTTDPTIVFNIAGILGLTFSHAASTALSGEFIFNVPDAATGISAIKFGVTTTSGADLIIDQIDIQRKRVGTATVQVGQDTTNRTFALTTLTGDDIEDITMNTASYSGLTLLNDDILNFRYRVDVSSPVAFNLHYIKIDYT